MPKSKKTENLSEKFPSYDRTLRFKYPDILPAKDLGDGAKEEVKKEQNEKVTMSRVNSRPSSAFLKPSSRPSTGRGRRSVSEVYELWRGAVANSEKNSQVATSLVAGDDTKQI